MKSHKDDRIFNGLAPGSLTIVVANHVMRVLRRYFPQEVHGHVVYDAIKDDWPFDVGDAHLTYAYWEALRRLKWAGRINFKYDDIRRPAFDALLSLTYEGWIVVENKSGVT